MLDIYNISYSPKSLSIRQAARAKGNIRYLALPKIGLQCLQYVISVIGKLKQLEVLCIDVLSKPDPLHVPTVLEENERQPLIPADTNLNQIHKKETIDDTFSVENDPNEGSVIDTAVQRRHLQVSSTPLNFIRISVCSHMFESRCWYRGVSEIINYFNKRLVSAGASPAIERSFYAI